MCNGVGGALCSLQEQDVATHSFFKASGYSQLLVPCRREAALAGWRGGGRSSMPLTLLLTQRSPTGGG
jgi:hypothetical protein